MNRIKLSIIVVLVALLGCEFESDEIYSLNIEPVDEPPALNVQLNLDDTDEIIFYENFEINIGFSNNTLLIKEVKFYLDNRELSAWVDNGVYKTDLRIYDFENHKFKIEIYTNSGSNSLADQLGSETFIFTSKEWTFIYRDPMPPYNIHDNGSIEISSQGASLAWNTYKGYSFEFGSYLIEKQGTTFSHETADTSFLDNTYVGEGTVYNVFILNPNNEKLHWATFTVEKNIPTLNMSSSDKQLLLTWEPSVYTQNIEAYQIDYQIPFSDAWQELATLPTENNLLNLDNYNSLIWGTEYEFRITTLPNANFEITDMLAFSNNNRLFMGHPSFKIDPMLVTNTNGFIFNNGDSICYFSNESDEVVPILPRWLTGSTRDGVYGSPDGNHILVERKNDVFEYYSLNPFQLVKTINIFTSDDYPTGPRITNNGMLTSTTWAGYLIYDIINEKIIFNGEDEIGVNTHIFPSSNGKYFVFYNKNEAEVYELIEEQLVSIYQTSNSDWEIMGGASHIPNDPLNFLRSGVTSDIKVKSISDLSILRTIETDGRYHIGIDFPNNQILSMEDNTLFIHDYNTGEKLSEITTGLDYIQDCRGKMVLLNDVIYYSDYKIYVKK